MANEELITGIDTQITQLVEEHTDLLNREQEYIEVVQNIRVRCNEIRGAVDALNKLKTTLVGPQTTEEVLNQGSGVCECGPNGDMKPLGAAEESENGDDNNGDGNE